MVSIMLLLTLCVCFCSCGSDVDNLIGTWGGKWEFKGNMISVSIVLEENGQYSATTSKNGTFSSSKTGSWELNGEELRLHENGDLNSSTVYYYRNGKVIHVGMDGSEDEFVKQGK